MTPFDAESIAKRGWRQGAVLDERLATSAREHAPSRIPCADGERLIITSHDCDLVNFSLEKEPVVEVLRAVVRRGKTPDGQQEGGRNPRLLQFEIQEGPGTMLFECRVHERWCMPRELLMNGEPASVLPDKVRRVVAEWLAKRYIRAAFPTEFDKRWRGHRGRNHKDWIRLLARHSQSIQGVYLRLSTTAELIAGEAYRCHLLVAVPERTRRKAEWPRECDAIETDISSFWKRCEPGVLFDGCEIVGTDEITLADLETYQRFDADWLSFADESASTPPAADMRT